MPFSLDPMLIFGNLVDAIFHRLCTYGLDISNTIIVNDGWDLGGPAVIFMDRKSTEWSR